MQHSSGRTTEVTFRKTGAEIKAAVARRREQVQRRLEQRNAALDTFMQDPRQVRSYLVRRSQPSIGHGQRGYVLTSRDDIASEEREEIDQLCQRIHEMEQELRRLALIAQHLDDEQVFQLRFDDLIC